MSCERGIDAGAFALHALDDEEARSFAAHLQDCAACRREVEQLQMVVDTLPVTAPQFAPPPQLRDRIMREVRAEAQLLQATGPELDRVEERPRREAPSWWHRISLRPGIAVALSCVLIALGIGTGVLLQGDDGPATRTLPAQVASTGARAELHVTGDHAALQVEGMPSPIEGNVYQVWFVKDDGKPIPTHTLFNVRDDGHANVQIDEPITGVKKILVTAEPSGGSVTPSGAPVISATPA